MERKNGKKRRTISRREFIKYGSIASAALAITGFPAIVRSQKMPDEIFIGMTYPLTGGGAGYGQDVYRAAEMMVNNINKSGGIKALNSAKVTMVMKDTETKLDVSTALTERFCQDSKISIVMGCLVSSYTLVTSQIAEKYKVPYINDNALSEKINQRGLKYTFTTRPTAPDYAKSIGNYLEYISLKSGQRPQTYALLNEDSEAGQAMAANLRLEIAKSPLKMKVVEDILYSNKALDFSNVVMKLKAAKPDLVMGFSYPGDGLALQRQMKQLDFNCMARMTVSSFESNPGYTRALGKTANYIFNTTEAYTNEKGNDELEKIAKQYQTLHGIDLSASSGLTILGLGTVWKALESVKSTDREEIREAIAKIRVASGEFGNIAVGEVKFDNNGRNIGTIPVVGQVQNEALHCVWPERNAVKTSVWPVPKWAERS